MKHYIKNHWPHAVSIVLWVYFAAAVSYEAASGIVPQSPTFEILVPWGIMNMLYPLRSPDVRAKILSLFTRCLAGKHPHDEMFRGMFNISEHKPKR